MNQSPRRHGKYVTPQGLVTIALVLVAAFCAADLAFNAPHYFRPSWLVIEALSFPLGWLIHWLAMLVFSPEKQFAGTFFVLLISAAGTVLNIHLFVSVIFWYFRKRNEQRSPEEREAEFQKLLAEHHKRNN